MNNQRHRRLNYLAISKHHIFTMMILALASSLLAVIPAQFVAGLADFYQFDAARTEQIVPRWLLTTFPDVIPDDGVAKFVFAVIGFLALASLADIVRNVFATYVISVSERSLHQLREKVFDSAIRRPLADYQHGTPSQAETIDTLRTDTDRVQLLLSQFILTTASDVLDLVWMTIMLWIMSPVIPVILLLSLPLLYVASLIGARRQRTAQLRTRTSEAAMLQHASDAIHHVERVKTSSAENMESAQLSHLSSEVVRGRMRATYVTSFFYPLSGFMKNTVVCSVLLIAVTALGIWNVSVTSGTLLLLFQYSMRFFSPINNFVHYYERLQQGKVSLDRVISTIEVPTEEANTPGAALESGRLSVFGRADDAITTGGATIMPRPIEDALVALGAGEAIVVGIPDDEWGEIAVAVTARLIDEDAARTALASRLGRTWVPRRIIALEAMDLTAMPTTPSGKPSRRVVEMLVREHLAPRHRAP